MNYQLFQTFKREQYCLKLINCNVVANINMLYKKEEYYTNLIRSRTHDFINEYTERINIIDKYYFLYNEINKLYRKEEYIIKLSEIRKNDVAEYLLKVDERRDQILIQHTREHLKLCASYNQLYIQYKSLANTVHNTSQLSPVIENYFDEPYMELSEFLKKHNSITFGDSHDHLR